jgi:NADH-quinone oxidoreductase subunit K
MFTQQITLNCTVFVLGLGGVLFNRNNMLFVLVSIEIMLLAINLNLICFSIYLDDFLGQIFSLFVLTVAAAESAIGLAILILYYRTYGNVSFGSTSIIKG